MDFSKLSNGDKIALGGGLLLFVSSFFPFFGFGTETIGGVVYGGGSTNGWDHNWVWIGLVLVLIGVAILVLRSLDITNIKIGTIKAEQLALMVVALGTLLIVIQLLVGWHGVPRKWGIWVAVVLAGVTLFGTFTAMRTKGIGLPDADDFRSLGGGGGAPPPPPPPPA
jgi:hypothetical protein